MNLAVRSLLVFALLIALACGGSSNEGPDSSNEGTGECPDKGQQFSMPCCLDHGREACASLQLFCAAFDGTGPICYDVYSRADGASCSEDWHCTSGACNANVGVCKATPGMQCDVAIGCAPLRDGTPTVCFGGRCSFGEIGDPCETADDCVEGNACPAGRCVYQWDCPLYQGSGPCSIRNQDDNACGECVYDAWRACEDDCFVEGQAVVDCRIAQGCSDGDELCLKERCASVFCAMWTCTVEDCPNYGECF
jgi:hypothetical protein